MSNRVSYVITPDHKIAHSYTAMDYSKHVSETLTAVQKWKAAHP
jgi:peroxiredoxin